MSTPPSERRWLEGELAGRLLGLDDLPNQLESPPAGLLGPFRRRQVARQFAGLQRRVATRTTPPGSTLTSDVIGSPSW